jgi:hypothetical protein
MRLPYAVRHRADVEFALSRAKADAKPRSCSRLVEYVYVRRNNNDQRITGKNS